MQQRKALIAKLASKLAVEDAAVSEFCRGIASTSAAFVRKQPLPVERPQGTAATLRAEGPEVAKIDSSDAAALTTPPVTPPGNSDLVDKVFGLDLTSSREKLKHRLTEIRRDFQRAEGDTGSPEVQAASLTERIAHMTTHLKTHRKDFSSRRGLQAMLSQRKKLLQYLRRSDFAAYTIALVRLGLKDNYAKQDRLTVRRKEASGRQS